METPDRSDAYIKIRRWTIGIGVSCLAMLIPANRAYVDWHRDFALEIVRGVVEPIQIAQQDTTDKLDFLVKAEASRLVDNIRTQLVILRLQEQTPQNRREIAELEQRLERAIAYRDCVFAERPNCDALRVF